LFAEVAAKEKIETRKVRKAQVAEAIAKKNEGMKSVKKFLSTSYRPLTKKQTSRSKGARISQIVRKAISLAAPKGGFVKAMTTDSESQGRGRPSGTYKVRSLPSGRLVKVPTHIYKKLVAAERTQMRLAQAQRQQYAEQVAMQQDPRFQPGAEEQFLAEQDPSHEMNVARAQAGYPIQVQEQGNVLQRAQGIGSQLIRGISNIGGVRAQPEQVVDQYGRTMPVRPQPQGQGIRREPQVSLFSPQRNILNAPNIFNNPGESELLLPRRRRLIS